MAQKHRVLIVFVCLSGIRKLQHKIFLKPPVISNYKNTFFSWYVAFFLAPKHEKTAPFFSYDLKKISIASLYSYKVVRGGVDPSFLNYQFFPSNLNCDILQSRNKFRIRVVLRWRGLFGLLLNLSKKRSNTCQV